MEQYRALSGEVIVYERPTGALAVFLARVVDAAHDPDVTESAFTELLYGRDNPLLDQTVFADRGMVTPGTKQQPAFGVMLDLLEQKWVQVGTLEARAVLPPKADPAHTMTVDEGGARMSVSPGAVRRLVESGQVVGSGEGDGLRLDPASVDAWVEQHDLDGDTRKWVMVEDVEVVLAELHILMGRRGGAVFQVKYPGELDEVTVIGDNRAGTLRRWSSVVVLLADQERCEFHLLRPAARREVLALRGFFVRGGFELAQSITDPDMAPAAFEGFEPA